MGSVYWTSYNLHFVNGLSDSNYNHFHLSVVRLLIELGGVMTALGTSIRVWR